MTQAIWASAPFTERGRLSICLEFPFLPPWAPPTPRKLRSVKCEQGGQCATSAPTSQLALAPQWTATRLPAPRSPASAPGLCSRGGLQSQGRPLLRRPRPQCPPSHQRSPWSSKIAPRLAGPLWEAPGQFYPCLHVDTGATEGAFRFGLLKQTHEDPRPELRPG